MSKRIIVNAIKGHVGSLLVVEQLFDEIGFGITPSKKSIINFNPEFNSERQVIEFIQSKNWVFEPLEGENELCELMPEK